MITKEQLTSVIEDLQGTCKSLVEVLTTFCLTEDNLSMSDYGRIDDEIFHCHSCGWWCEISEATSCEMHDEETCTDCCEHDEEEE